MIRKVLSFEVKEVSPRVLEFVGSAESKDRIGDEIKVAGWQLKNYKKNPVFLWAHNYETPPVGKAVKVWVDDDRLKFHIQFAEKDEYEFADTIYKLYKGGYLRGSSVGFMPIESEPIEIKDDGNGGDSFGHIPTRYLKQELLELSGCPVPAHPDALAEAKTKGLITDDLMQEISAAEVEDLTEKPYPNEHACRLNDPSQYDRFARKNCEIKHEGKCIDVIYGIKEGKSEIQAYRYDKETWTAQEASSHCKEHEGTFEAATNEGKTEANYDATAGILTAPSQVQIGDDLDYLLACIRTEGLNEQNLKASWALVDELIRLSGTIPANIAEKIGASKETEMTQEDISKIIQESIERVINQAKGKIK